MKRYRQAARKQGAFERHADFRSTLTARARPSFRHVACELRSLFQHHLAALLHVLLDSSLHGVADAAPSRIQPGDQRGINLGAFGDCDLAGCLL